MHHTWARHEYFENWIDSQHVIDFCFYYIPESCLVILERPKRYNIKNSETSGSLPAHSGFTFGSIQIHIWITPVFLQCSDGITEVWIYVFDRLLKIPLPWLGILKYASYRIILWDATCTAYCDAMQLNHS